MSKQIGRSLVQCLLALVLLASFSTSVRANMVLSETCMKTAEALNNAAPVEMLASLDFAGCLGGDLDKENPLSKAIEEIELPSGPDTGRKLHAVSRKLGLIEQHLFEVQAQATDMARPVIVRLQTKLLSLRENLRELDDPEVSVDDTDLAGAGNWEWASGANRFRGFTVGLNDYLTAACSTRSSSQCTETIQAAAMIFRSVRLARKILLIVALPELKSGAAYLRSRHARWSSYIQTVRPQYPWELGINSALIARDGRKRNGFTEPPEWQLILLHPGVGFEYVRDAPDGSQLEGAVYLELIGANFWRWSPLDEPEKGMGGSIITTFSDRAGLKDTAWGVMLHWRHRYSLAITKRGGDTGVMVNLDVSDWFSDRKKDVDSLVRRFD